MPRIGRASSAVAVTTSAVVSATPCTFRGLTVQNDSGGSATYVVYDNASAASGTVLASVTLADGASVFEPFPDGVAAENGLYFSATDTCVGSVFVGHV